MGNGNDSILSEEHFENSKTSRGFYFLLISTYFCPNVLILSRDFFRDWKFCIGSVTKNDKHFPALPST
jgi:hypothetical protein